MTDRRERTGAAASPSSSARPQRPGFVLYRGGVVRPDRALVEAFRGVPAANVSDVQGRHLTMHYGVKPIYQPMPPLLGVAMTVKARPGDNLMAMKAIEEAEPGDVLVISSDGEANLSVWGGIMSTMAVRRGIAGVVTDGLVRDVTQTRGVGLPVFATGLTPAGPTKEGPGQINAAVACGNVVVRPGDIVLGDDDGVVVVPREDAAAVLEAVRARQAKEQSWLEHIARNDLSPLVNTDEDLAARGCRIVSW
ncbi:MAG TPA: RraA family protein [bacterium]|nr:RraA family protein [bacterium]